MRTTLPGGRVALSVLEREEGEAVDEPEKIDYAAKEGCGDRRGERVVMRAK